MTRIEAHEVLYAAEAGANIPAWRNTQALRVTGDMDPDDCAHIVTPVGAWERGAAVRLMALATPFDGLLA
jgi:hypothetical protein